MTITKTKLLSYFRPGRLIVGEHEGKLYVSDSYLMFGFDAKKSLLADLLADYNLKPEPMVCEVGSTIRLCEGQPPPNLGMYLVPPDKTYQLATSQTIGGFPVLLQHTAGLSEVWETKKGLRLSVAQEKRGLIDELVPRGKWMARDDVKPMVKVGDDNQVLAVVMPVRTMFDTAAKAA
jgi:hypothetical protein